MKPGSPGIAEAGRRVHKLRALRSSDQTGQAEVIHRAVDFRRREERLPAQARIDGQVRSHLPGILHIEIHEPLFLQQIVRQRHRIGAEFSQQESGKVVEGPVGLRVDVPIEEHLGHFSAAAEVDLMVAVNPTDVVVELQRRAVSFGLAAGAGAYGKSAGHGETALVRHISAINRHAQIAGRDIVGGS